MTCVGTVGSSNRIGRSVHVVAYRAAVSVNIHKSEADRIVPYVDGFGVVRNHNIAIAATGDNTIVFDDHDPVRR